MKDDAGRRNDLNNLISFIFLKMRWVNFYANLKLDDLVIILMMLDSVRISINTPGFEKYSKAILLPPVEVQKNQLAALKNAYQRFNPEEIWLSPDTVAPNFPDNISLENRPEGVPYILFLEDTKEPPEKTRDVVHDRVKKPPQLRKMFEKQGETGLNLFEYLVWRHWYITQRDNVFPDEIYSTWLLDSSLPDGKILVAKRDKSGKLRICAWPATYGEHNSQAARYGKIVLLG